MASVARRDRDGQTSWRVRWRDPEGRQRSRSFGRRVDAERFRGTVTADLLRGTYIDPNAGKELFRAYALDWLAAQTFDASTAQAVEIRLRLHAFPVLGPLPLRAIKPSKIQAWVRGLDRLAPTYRKVIFANVSTVFAAAVDDELLTRNPCRAPSVKRPKADRRKVTPWSAAQVHAVHGALPDRYRPIARLGAGLGLRQGEMFGLCPDDVDFLGGRVAVVRQVKLFANNQLVFGLPKGGKTREVPLPSSVREELAAYLTRYPARPVTLPWGHPGGELVTVPLVLTSREGKALNRNYFNPFIWKKTLRACEVPPTRDNGSHALRHFYASVLLDAGESIKAVSEFLGHSDPGFTLRTYTHLMPTSADRTKRAVDAALCVPDVYPDAAGES